MWPDGPTHIGLKIIHCIESAYPEEQVSFVWFFTCILSHKCKNQEECGQMYQELKEQKMEGKREIKKEEKFKNKNKKGG